MAHPWLTPDHAPKRHFPASLCKVLLSRQGNPITFSPSTPYKRKKQRKRTRKHNLIRPIQNSLSLIDFLWEALALPPPSRFPSSSSSPHFLPLFITRWGSDHPPDLCFRKDRTSFVGLSSPKNKAILGVFECFYPQRCPTSLDPGHPGLTVHEKALTGLPPSPTASPAPVRRQLVDFIAQVIANRCMPGPRGPYVRAWVVSYITLGVCVRAHVCVCVCVCNLFVIILLHAARRAITAALATAVAFT